jgi:hypothetical protein
MAQRSGRRRLRPVLVALTATLAVLAAGCGSASDGSTGEADAAGWIAAELGSVPEGFEIAEAVASSNDGRRIDYRAIEPNPLGADGHQIQVTTRVPMGWTVDELIAAYDGGSEDDIETEVQGHRALVVPATSDGRQYGWEVIWDQLPGVQVHVRDTRHDASMTQTATRESALELAEGVSGMTRADWVDASDAHPSASPGARPGEGAVESEVADGVLDARQWTLSVLEDPADTSGFQSCFRLGYAGEDTGPGCSVQRVVLGGKGFVIGWTGFSDEAPELLPGPGSSFDPIRPQVHAFGSNLEIPESHVWIAVLPDGACGVEYRRPGSLPIETAVPLNLLPGDPGSVECSTG